MNSEQLIHKIKDAALSMNNIKRHIICVESTLPTLKDNISCLKEVLDELHTEIYPVLEKREKNE